MVDIPEKTPIVPGFSLRFTPSEEMPEETFMKKLREIAGLPTKEGFPRAKLQITPAKDQTPGAKDYILYMDIPLDYDAAKRENPAARGEELEHLAAMAMLEKLPRPKQILAEGLRESGLDRYVSGGLSR